MTTPESPLLSADSMRPVVRTSLSDEIIAQILDLIKRSVLAPGDRLPPERELCKRFGVGRSSLREALRSLSAMGILDGRVGEGTFVNDNHQFLEKALQWGLLLDRKKVQDLIETRLMLESENAFWAAQRAQDEDLRAIEEALVEMKRALGTSVDFLAADLRFHLAVAAATQNTILASLLEATRGYLQEWIERSLAEPTRAQARARLSLEQHGRIVGALRAGDGQAAREAMREHLLSSGEDLQGQIEA
jgi:GntR family transcriptional regulator, transcriptional repressor for pyruvate dehydrogenase complex